MSRKEAQQITSFFSSINIYWLLRKESAETSNLIYFFSVYNREILTDSDGCENVTWKVNLRCLKLYRAYAIQFNSSDVGNFF